MWYFPSEPGNGNVDALSGRTVTAVNASGALTAVESVGATVGPVAIAADDDAVADVGSAVLDPRPPGEHAARPSAATRRNAVRSLRVAPLGRVIGITSGLSRVSESWGSRVALTRSVEALSCTSRAGEPALPGPWSPVPDGPAVAVRAMPPPCSDHEQPVVGLSMLPVSSANSTSRR